MGHFFICMIKSPKYENWTRDLVFGREELSACNRSGQFFRGMVVRSGGGKVRRGTGIDNVGLGTFVPSLRRASPDGLDSFLMTFLLLQVCARNVKVYFDRISGGGG